MEIFWTPKARQTYFKVLNYLDQAWTEKEIQTFILKVGNILDKIRQNPEMFEESRKRKNVRKGLITKHNMLYFRVRPRKNEIHLLIFWDNRQDRGKLTF